MTRDVSTAESPGPVQDAAPVPPAPAPTQAPASAIATLQTRPADPPEPPPNYGNLIIIGAVLVGVFLLIVLVRWLMQVSRWVFVAAAIVFGGIWTANTLYNRTEPAFLTPLFNVLAEFFPTKDFERQDAGGPALQPDKGAPKK